MAIRATDLTILAALLLLAGAGIASSAERTDARAQAAAAAYPVATDTRVGGDDAQTRFVMDFSHKVELRAFTLADPYRVVIDLPQVTFKLPPKTGETGRGLVKAFRFGLVMQGGSRIVIDVDKPVRIDKAFVLDAAEGQPARLVVDLAATDRESFLRTLAAEEPPAARRDGRRGGARGRAQGRSAADHRARSRPRRHRQRHRRGERRDGKGHRAAISRCCCATRSRDPANIAW